MRGRDKSFHFHDGWASQKSSLLLARTLAEFLQDWNGATAKQRRS